MRLVLVLGLIPLVLSAKAVKVDELLTETNKIQSDVSISYANIQRNSGDVGLVEYQSANGDFVVVPTYMGNIESQSDRLMYSLSLRYGLNKDVEIFGFGNLYSSTERTLSASGTSSHSDSGFSSSGIGGVYQVRGEDDYPAVLVGGTVDLIDHDETLKKNFYLKSGSVFVSSYYTSDPVVFFLKASYGYNEKHTNGSHSLETGNVLSITPQIHFAVNPYTSLNWGVRYQYKQKDTYDSNAISTNQSQLGWLFGASYEINTKNVISADMEKTDTSTYSQSTFALNYSYKF
jgi:hypothetical protein